jgi:hypothetical protein
MDKENEDLFQEYGIDILEFGKEKANILLKETLELSKSTPEVSLNEQSFKFSFFFF